MLRRILQLLASRPPACLWYRKVGGQDYCFNGGDADEIRRCFSEHEAEARLLWEINEVSDDELSGILSELEKARDDFESYLGQRNVENRLHNY